MRYGTWTGATCTGRSASPASGRAGFGQPPTSASSRPWPGRWASSRGVRLVKKLKKSFRIHARLRHKKLVRAITRSPQETTEKREPSSPIETIVAESTEKEDRDA